MADTNDKMASSATLINLVNDLSPDAQHEEEELPSAEQCLREICQNIMFKPAVDIIQNYRDKYMSSETAKNLTEFLGKEGEIPSGLIVLSFGREQMMMALNHVITETMQAPKKTKSSKAFMAKQITRLFVLMSMPREPWSRRPPRHPTTKETKRINVVEKGLSELKTIMDKLWTNPVPDETNESNTSQQTGGSLRITLVLVRKILSSGGHVHLSRKKHVQIPSVLPLKSEETPIEVARARGNCFKQISEGPPKKQKRKLKILVGKVPDMSRTCPGCPNLSSY
jgi:hypothetical protein